VGSFSLLLYIFIYNRREIDMDGYRDIAISIDIDRIIDKDIDREI
jgi:hypothetical protein